jgi:hypothetical protein
VFGTDDTTAWRNAIAAIGAAGQGIAYCSRVGISVLAAAATTPSGFGSAGVLNLPKFFSFSVTTNLFPVVGIMGPVPPSMPFAEADASVDNYSSLVLFANASGAQASTGGSATASVINAGLPGSSAFNNLKFYGANFTVRVPMSSPFNGINMLWAQQVQLENVICDIQTDSIETMLQPQGGNTGIKMPTISNGAVSIAKVATVIGYETGFNIGEHFDGDVITAGYCTNSYAVGTCNHGLHISRAGSYWSTNHLTSYSAQGGIDQALLNWEVLDIEDAPSAHWYTTSYHVYDTANYLYGPLRMVRVTAGVGPTYAYPTVDGGTNLHLEVIGGPAWQTVSLINSWTNAAGATQYRKDSTGTVELQIVATAGGGVAKAFTLPAGFRVGQTVDLPGNIYTGAVFEYGVVNLSTNGDVQLFTTAVAAPTSGYLVLAVIKYIAEG